jgi:TRAP-type C4-dicarboxylate transport system substrate-binding protein
MDDLIALGMLQSGPYYIHTRKPVASLADLRGLKLRVSGKLPAITISSS